MKTHPACQRTRSAAKPQTPTEEKNKKVTIELEFRTATTASGPKKIKAVSN